MKQALKDFFKKFLKENRGQFAQSSFWRIFGCIQTLFWPFAFAKIIDIIVQDPGSWKKVVPWVFAMVANKIIEDVIRLRSKYGLQELALLLRIDIVKFFTKQTKVRNDIKTGEAVQAVRNMADTVYNIGCLYKDKLIQLPINFIAIPIILFSSEVSYFILVLAYIALYLLVDYIAATFYLKEVKDSFKASEAFWGTVNRKAPDVWRQREDEFAFEKAIDEQGAKFYKEENEAQNVHHWRWVAIQALSSMFYGIAIVLVFYRIINDQAHVGDLVLVIGYFGQTQTSLNIVSDTIKQITDARIAFDELEESIEAR